METSEIVKKIKEEHEVLMDYLEVLEYLPEKENINLLQSVINQLTLIYDFWNEHEKKEETFFGTLANNFPVKKMEIAHQEIRGHWKVLLLAIESKDEDKIITAIETDGKMFADKLKRHMAVEEKILGRYLKN